MASLASFWERDVTVRWWMGLKTTFWCKYYKNSDAVRLGAGGSLLGRRVIHGG
jgi:hypothetical protein